MSTVLLTRIADHIGRITINRQEVHNALNFETVDRFAAAVEAAHGDADLRVLLVTGAGDRAFCAGGDLKELAEFTTEADGWRVSAGMTAALNRLEQLPVPTIAVLNGLARGGGAEVSLACDLRIMSAAATWGFTQASLAVTPGWGSGQRLLRLVGYPRALSWLIEGRVLDAGEALTSGVVQRVAPLQDLEAVSIAWANEIAARPRELLVGIKRILRAGLTHSPDEAARTEADVFPPLWAGEAHHIAVSRFLNRRA